MSSRPAKKITLTQAEAYFVEQGTWTLEDVLTHRQERAARRAAQRTQAQGAHAPAKPNPPPKTNIAKFTPAKIAIAENAQAKSAIVETAPLPAKIAEVEAKPATGKSFFTGVLDDVFERILPDTHDSDFKVFMYLYWRAWSFKHNQTGRVKISHGELAKACKISPRQVQTSANRLIGAKLIRRLNQGRTATPEYEMLVASGVKRENGAAKIAIAKLADRSEKSDIKENKRRLAPQEIEERAKAAHAAIMAGTPESDVLRELSTSVHAVDLSAIRAMLKHQRGSA